jgi:hemerythrin superfamily protein
MFGIGESENDAIEMLKKDHQEVDTLFDEYESKNEKSKRAGKSEIARVICRALSVHATIEEEIFYPTVRKHGEEMKKLVDEAAVEHQSLKDIIGRLESASSSDPLYDAGVKVLSEYVKHHVKEEEGELFPKVRASGVDLEALGQRMKARKAQLEAASARKLRSAA